MTKKPHNAGNEEDGKLPQRMLLSGRLKHRGQGIVQIELIQGLTMDISEDDCNLVQETTDAVTQRAVVLIELKGDKPITAVFQPHFYRVLASAPTVPFVFRPPRGMTSHEFAAVMARPVGGGGGADHTTDMLTNSWIGTQKDGSKPDSADEPGEIVLN
jgi:hypothetical protein